MIYRKCRQCGGEHPIGVKCDKPSQPRSLCSTLSGHAIDTTMPRLAIDNFRRQCDEAFDGGPYTVVSTRNPAQGTFTLKAIGFRQPD